MIHYFGGRVKTYICNFVDIWVSFFSRGHFLFILSRSCLSGYIMWVILTKVIFIFFIFFIVLNDLYLMTHYFETREITLFFVVSE